MCPLVGVLAASISAAEAATACSASIAVSLAGGVRWQVLQYVWDICLVRVIDPWHPAQALSICFCSMATDTSGPGPAPVHGLLQIYPVALFLARHRMTVGASRQACMVATAACIIVCLMGLVIEGDRVHSNSLRIGAFPPPAF